MHKQASTTISFTKWIKSAFLLAVKETVDKKRSMLDKRFQGTFAVPGTRSFHQFVPVGEHAIATKRCSDDIPFVLQHDLYCQASVVNVDINDIVSCLYENTWWIGLVMEIENEQNDACGKFMHPHSPGRSFHWPERDDIWVPMVHILDKINVPSTTPGRQYILDPSDVARISAKFV